MAPHRVGTPCRIEGDVVDGSVVGGPGRARADADDLVGVLLSGTKIPEPQRITLVADYVDGIGQHISVRADAGGPEREEIVPFGFDVFVEQHLLAGDLGIFVEDRWVPVSRIGYRATALDTVLLAFETASVVPPVAPADRYRQVSFLGARLDLIEDALAQRLEGGSRLGGVVVLGLQIGEHLRAGLVAQPFVRIDEHVMVEFSPGIDPLGDRRFSNIRHALGPIQSSNCNPEMRSYASI